MPRKLKPAKKPKIIAELKRSEVFIQICFEELYTQNSRLSMFGSGGIGNGSKKNSVSDPTFQSVVRLDSSEKALREAINASNEVRTRFVMMISHLSDLEMKAVSERYLNKKTIEAISKEMNLSLSYLKSILAKAMNTLCEMEEQEEQENKVLEETEQKG